MIRYQLRKMLNRSKEFGKPIIARSTETAIFLNFIAKLVQAKEYLEIGVESGETFRRVRIKKKTGVDPLFLFDFKKQNQDKARFFEMTSDAFFEMLINGGFESSNYDLVFIDGLHTFEQVARDFKNCVQFMNRNGIMVIDDTVPNDVFSSLPSQEDCYRLRKASGKHDDGSWHGDVFKLIYQLSLAEYEPLRIATISDLSNPKTVVWIENSNWKDLKIELNSNDVAYEDLFRNGIPDCFNPITKNEFFKYAKKNLLSTKVV